MKHKLQSIFNSRIIKCAAIILMSASVNSCTKSSSTNADAPFLGTWNGTSSCGGAATITFTGSGNTVMTNGTAGTGSCLKSIEYSGTASGSTIAFPSTVYTDDCGNSYTFSGSGTLNGSTLTCTFNISGNGVSGSCTFTGTK